MLTPKKLVLALLGASVLLAAPIVPSTVAYAAEDEAAPTDTQAVDEALDLYWAKKRKVVSIHERRFLKQSRHEFTLFGGVIPNDEFFTYIPLGGRYNYYFNEDIGAEVWGSYILKRNSDLKDFLEGDQFNNSFVVSIPQNLLWMAGLDVIWSPIHGKFAIFKTKLTHFDIHLAFGVGAIGTKVRELDADKKRGRRGRQRRLGHALLPDRRRHASLRLPPVLLRRGELENGTGGGLSQPRRSSPWACRS